MTTWRVGSDRNRIKRPQLVQVGIGRRRIATLMGEPRDFRALVRELDGSTHKRRAAKGYAQLRHRIRLLPTRTYPPPDAASRNDIERSLQPVQQVASAMGLELRSFAVFWPTADRAHRRYVVATDQGGRVRLFAKVSLDVATDQARFEQEDKMLRGLAETGLRGWRTPHTYGVVGDEGCCTSLVLQPLPARRRQLQWAQIAKDLPLAPTSRAPAIAPLPGGTTWFGPALQIEMSADVRRLVESAADRCGYLGLANGDISPSNALRVGRERWLIDWEFGAWDAPRDVDVVVGLLTSRAIRLPNSRPEDLLRWLRASAHRCGLEDDMTALSLLYLSTVNRAWAPRLLTLSWPADPSAKRGEVRSWRHRTTRA